MSNTSPSQTPGAGVQIVTMVLYSGLAIPVTIVAMQQFWVAGLIVAIMAFSFFPSPNQEMHGEDWVEKIKPDFDFMAKFQNTSGNASFDKYRQDLLERLEDEQASFKAFLVRLRDAKDQTEFDEFMEDRAQALKSAEA